MHPKVDNKKCALYRIVHRDSGNDYIGISVDHLRRWNSHRSHAKTGRNKCPKFYNALRKYGCEAFDWYVIAYATTFAGGVVLEKLALKLGFGSYNCTEGGHVPPFSAVPKEARARAAAKLRGRKRPSWHIEAMTGHKQTPEHVAKLSAARKGRIITAEWRANISLGVKLERALNGVSEETKAKRRATRKANKEKQLLQEQPNNA